MSFWGFSLLSYRHAFHAGNHADVFKHWVLSLLLESLCRKDKPFFVLDTHAGAGRYDLSAPKSQKNQEHAEGIQRFWGQMGGISSLAAYEGALGTLPVKGPIRWYPGSPMIIHHFLRQKDRLVLSELHPEDFSHLSRRFAEDSRVKVLPQDGYELIKALLPPPERRGLVHVDPAYERKDESMRLLEAIREGYRRWASGCFAIWYPIQGRRTFDEIPRGIRRLGIPKTLALEYVLEARDPKGLLGSGMILINPPYPLETTLKEDLPKVVSRLSGGGAFRQSVAWLMPEKV